MAVRRANQLRTGDTHSDNRHAKNPELEGDEGDILPLGVLKARKFLSQVTIRVRAYTYIITGQLRETRQRLSRLT
jgi:hypothetical protein